jgi:hypothetical protein
MSTNHAHVTVIGAVMLFALAPAPARGQTVRGAIRDSSTNEGLPSARVALVSATGDTTAVTFSADDGSFSVGAPAPGAFTVSVLRIGFTPLVEGPLTLAAGETIDVVFHMAVLAVPLDPVIVQAEAHVRYLEEAGFYERERIGFGHHLDPEWIETRKTATPRVSDFMSGLPGARVMDSPQAGTGRSIVLACGTPRYYVDDVRAWGQIDEWVDGSDVLAIEVYSRSTGTPPRYGTCAVLIWTQFRAERRFIR